MKEIEGDLVLEEDAEFDKSIKVSGEIRGKDGERFDLAVDGHIDAGYIETGNIEAVDIDAVDIDAWDIDVDGKLSYYAFCNAYGSIRAESIESLREPAAEPVALDGEVVETETDEADS